MGIPKLPPQSPIPKGTPPPQPPPPSFGAGTDSGPSARTPSSPKLRPDEDQQRRRKEEERVAKWMRMMSVKRRDEGGNIAGWQWKKDVKGTKVGSAVG